MQLKSVHVYKNRLVCLSALYIVFVNRLLYVQVVDANDIESPVDGEVKDGGPTRHYCGAGPCRPKHLQVFANSKFFTAILCLFAMTETALISGKLNILTKTHCQNPLGCM